MSYGAELDRRIGEASDAIERHLDAEPSLGQPRLVAVLGSGLGGVVELLDPEPRLRLSYRDIPHVPGTAVEGHAGELVAGTVAGTPAILLVWQGASLRGLLAARVDPPAPRLRSRLGLDTVVLTNAAGGLNPDFDPGDVMLIADHINLSGDNPLTGPNLDRFGARFPPMVDAYDPAYRVAALEAGERTGVALREGVYIMLSGPSYETRAELRMLRTLGGDAVGMSTAHEAHRGAPCRARACSGSASSPTRPPTTSRPAPHTTRSSRWGRSARRSS